MVETLVDPALLMDDGIAHLPNPTQHRFNLCHRVGLNEVLVSTHNNYNWAKT